MIGLGKPKLCTKFKVASFSRCRILKGKPQIPGSSPSSGPHPFCVLVGFDDGPWQTPCQIWNCWLYLLRKYTKICFWTPNLLFEPLFGGVRGNVRTSSIARLKARSRLPIRDNWTFSLAVPADALICRNRLCWRGWVTLGLNIRFKGYVYRQRIYTVR